MKPFVLLLLALLTATAAFAQRTFYTTGLGSGEWSDPAAWSLHPDQPQSGGVPAATDHVVIRHYLTHRCGEAYLHRGNVHISAGGVYEILSGFDSGAPYAFTGQAFDIAGALITTGDFRLQEASAAAGSTLTLRNSAQVFIGGSLVLNGSSQVTLQEPACGAVQTLGQVDFRSEQAFICGTGGIVAAKGVAVWDRQGTRIADSLKAALAAADRMCQDAAIFASGEACESRTALAAGKPLSSPSGPVLSIFPNPAAASQVYAVAEGFAAAEPVRAEVRSLTGQLLYELALTADPDGRVRMRNALPLQSGAYVLTFRSGHTAASGKLVIL
ncbi:MAG: T9SS type A sorting domain-containing protein [Bacteroidia bacterium]|nr:T9SS type A sorting domain-containing protein [Bacteroidia bacterium]